METLLRTKEPAIVRGIKAVGVGKKGSKPLEPELIHEIISDLKNGKVTPASKGAFFAGLIIKGIDADEKTLEEALPTGALDDLEKLVEHITPEAPKFVKDICVHILKGPTLDKESAYRLGKFLFSNSPGDGARGIIASALRVRYETSDEYQGLLGAMQDTIEKPFCEKVPDGEPIIQLAEPFDGVDNSYLITPLIADYIQSLGFRVISMVGRNSGPKWGNTLLDLIKTLNVSPISGNKDLMGKKPDFGWYINQENLSHAVNRWVEIRKQTVKRPFLSTLEKFLNPAKAQIVITSAFHAPYTEKMMTVAERAGYPSAIIMRNGQEGSLSFPLNRPVKALCSVVQCEGDYKREELELNPSELLGFEIKTDEKLTNPSLEENARLIKIYKQKGKSGNEIFDNRVKITCGGLKRALDWIKYYIPK